MDGTPRRNVSAEVKTYLVVIKRQVIPGVVATLFAITLATDCDHAAEIAQRNVGSIVRIPDVIEAPSAPHLRVLGDFDLLTTRPANV